MSSDEDRNVGLGPYAAAEATPARSVLVKLLQKARLRAALSAIQADIDASIVALDRSQLTELQSLMAAHVQMLEGAEAEDRRAIAEEAALSQTAEGTFGRTLSQIVCLDRTRGGTKGRARYLSKYPVLDW